jgi:hypothetical protein
MHRIAARQRINDAGVMGADDSPAQPDGELDGR